MKEPEPHDWGEVFGELRDSDGGRGIPPDERTVEARKLDPHESLVRRGRRLLQKPHGSGRGPRGDPSVSEIRAMAAAISADWNSLERRSRSTRSDPAPVETKRVRIGR